MKKLFIIITITVLFVVDGKAQITWEKLFSKNSTDVFRCIREVPAGGYIVAGYTSDFTANDTDAYVVRLNSSGDTTWTFTYNGPLSKKDLFYKVITTSDGGFALCGYTSSVSGTSDDALYLKLNSAGQQQWVKFYTGSGRERAQDIIQTADNGYAIVGYTSTLPAQYYDAFIVRTNSSGDTLWTKRYGGSNGISNYDDANSIKLLPDGGFILGGQSFNGLNGYDQSLIRINSIGTVIWSKRFGTVKSENIDEVSLLPDGFILAGNTNTDSNGDDGYLVKTDTGGTVLWAKSFGGSLPDDFHTVDTTSDGGFILTGTTTSTGGLFPNMWLMRTNSAGDSLWSNAYGGDNHDHGYSGQQTSDGGYIIAGHTGSFGFNNEEGYIVKTGPSGNDPNKLTYTTVLAIVSPTSTTCGSANTQLKIKLRNFGNQSVTNIPVTVEITGAITQTINQTFSASSDTVTFNTTINTSAGGTYTFHFYTNNNNDVYPARNSSMATFTINITPAAPTSVTNNSRCGNGTVVLGASATSTIYWYGSSSGGSSLNSGTSYTTPSLNSTTTYYVQTGTTCPSARIPVVATVNPVSANPVTVGDSRCGSGILTLSATASDPITWYDAPSGGSSVGTGTSFTTPVLTATTNYYAQATNGNCPSSRILTIATIGTPANDPGTTSSQRCGPGTVLLTASSPDPILWFDSLSGGSQVGTGATFTTPSLTSTKTYYAQSNNGCLSNRIAATATINTPPLDPVTYSNQRCGPGIVKINATDADAVIWFDAASGGNQVGFGDTLTTPVISQTTTYYAQANNGTCTSNRIATVATVHPLPVINLGTDTIVNGISYQLNAGSGFSSYLWSTSETSQTISISSTDTFCVTVTDVNGCKNDDCIIVDIINGVSEFENDKLFSVYPNPTNGSITILYPPSFSEIKIEILNITGEVVKMVDANDLSSVNIDLSSFSKGIYLLKINTDSYFVIKKLMVQ